MFLVLLVPAQYTISTVIHVISVYQPLLARVCEDMHVLSLYNMCTSRVLVLVVESELTTVIGVHTVASK